MAILPGALMIAVAALFWQLVLLALGSADPLTRTDYHVPDARVK